METLYLVCAAVGGTLLVCQFLLGLLGLGHHDIDHDHDVGGHDHDHGADHEHHGSWYTGILTLRCQQASGRWEEIWKQPPNQSGAA